MTEQKGRSTLTIVLIVVGVALVAIVGVIGILAALGISGFTRYMTAAKQAEGRSEAMRLARGIASCAEENRANGVEPLPPTSPAVPASLREVAGKKYMSAPGDWSHAAFTCAAYSFSMPQYFQYQWEKQSATVGVARAIADTNGDGSPDATFEVKVDCTTGRCSSGALLQR